MSDLSETYVTKHCKKVTLFTLNKLLLIIDDGRPGNIKIAEAQVSCLNRVNLKNIVPVTGDDRVKRN